MGDRLEQQETTTTTISMGVDGKGLRVKCWGIYLSLLKYYNN